MKKSFLAAALLALTSSTAFAADSGVTAGVKFGRLLIDVTEIGTIKDISDGKTNGLTLGYDFGNNFSLDLELLPGNISGTYYKNLIHLDLDTAALYGTYRSEGPAYLLAKLGLVRNHFDGDSETGAGYGIGGGFRFNDNIGIELEYTIIDQDINLLGLGLRAKF